MTPYIKSKSFCRSSNRGISVSSILVVVAICCLGVLYVIQTNDLVALEYEKRHSKEHLENLQTENQKLELAAVQLQAPANLEEMIEKLGLVEAEKIIYLEEQETVAVKK